MEERIADIEALMPSTVFKQIGSQPHRKPSEETARYAVITSWAGNEVCGAEIKISMSGKGWSEFEKQPFYKELFEFLDNKEKGGMEMTPEQKRLEELLMKYIEHQINAHEVPFGHGVPETAQALIELWKLTEFEQVRS